MIYTPSIKSPEDSYIAFAEKGASNAKMTKSKILHQSIFWVVPMLVLVRLFPFPSRATWLVFESAIQVSSQWSLPLSFPSIVS
jgi:hypothetical protein